MDIYEKLDKHIAVVDLGSNTFNLIIGSLNEFKIVHKHRIPVGIGNLSYANNILSPEAIKNATNALKAFANICLDYNVFEIHCYATSAIRDAQNKDVLLHQFHEIDSRIIVNVIDGDKEASLIAEGVKVLVPKTTSYLIMDIGGGSVEFIAVKNNVLLWKRSYDIGIARLVQYFPHSNPLTIEESEKVIGFLQNELKELFVVCKNYNITNLVGASGSFETYFVLLDKLSNKEFSTLNSSSILLLTNQLIFSSQENLLLNKDIPDFRVKLLPYASILVRLIITQLKISTVMYSDYSMKEGAYSVLLNERY